jgi:hypothetical protein
MGVSIRPSDFVDNDEDIGYPDYETTGKILKNCINCEHYHDSNTGREYGFLFWSDVSRHLCVRRNKIKILDDPMVGICWHYKQRKQRTKFHVLVMAQQEADYFSALQKLISRKNG